MGDKNHTLTHGSARAEVPEVTMAHFAPALSSDDTNVLVPKFPPNATPEGRRAHSMRY